MTSALRAKRSMMLQRGTAVAMSLAGATLAGLMLQLPAQANVPVNDALRLSQQAQTNHHVTTSVSAVNGTQSATKGIKCATTTGGNVPVVNPAVIPASGSASIQGLVPDLGSAVGGSSGSSLNALGSAIGSVLAGVNALAQTESSSASAYQNLSGMIGTAQTVMQAMDQNSAVRAQNGETAAAAVVAANQLTQAYNTKNLMVITETSGVASALGGGTTSSVSNAAVPVAVGVCPFGTSGAGTMASPCVESACSTTAYGIAPDPNCVTQRLVDNFGNVRVFLAKAQDSFAGLTPTN